jgi:uncharacterized protein YgiM (DUF1202 family)
MSAKQFLILFLILSLSTATAFAATPKIMSVQNRNAELRETPSPFGRIVSSLSYGDKVTVNEQNGAWMKVSASGTSGWVHSSALTTKTIVMKSGEAAQTSASSGEMALAGKGFNAEVEAQFKANHKDIDFKWVDRMEKIVIPSSKIKTFIEDGGLTSSAKGGVQ